MDDYLGKPFEQAQLVAVLNRWLPSVGPVARPPAAARSSLRRLNHPSRKRRQPAQWRRNWPRRLPRCRPPRANA
ncbi:MAG: hypothetical protein U1F42_07985 [Candidatus Competibacteraceae bacterium]